MPTPEEHLASRGYSIETDLRPGAVYRPVVVDGTTVYVSGCVPFASQGNLASKGKVPSQVSLEEAKKAAELCAANILRLVRQELGSLERIERVLRVTGYVNSDPDFTDQHVVINGASELLVAVFGPEKGIHARTAVGMAQLPLGSSVEVEAILKLKA